MKKEEILSKAIEKAIKRNFLGLKDQERIVIDVSFDMDKEIKEIDICFDWAVREIDGEMVECEPGCCGKNYFFSVDELIFNHDFAKAFWGEFSWDYHIRTISMEKDRIKYLERYI